MARLTRSYKESFLSSTLEFLEIRTPVRAKHIGQSDYGGCISAESTHYVIELSDDADEITIAHECIHIRQLESGRLRFRGDNPVFDGIEYIYDGIYRVNAPWEEEAYGLEKVVAENVIHARNYRQNNPGIRM